MYFIDDQYRFYLISTENNNMMQLELIIMISKNLHPVIINLVNKILPEVYNYFIIQGNTNHQ